MHSSFILSPSQQLLILQSPAIFIQTEMLNFELIVSYKVNEVNEH